MNSFHFSTSQVNLCSFKLNLHGPYGSFGLKTTSPWTTLKWHKYHSSPPPPNPNLSFPPYINTTPFQFLPSSTAVVSVLLFSSSFSLFGFLYWLCCSLLNKARIASWSVPTNGPLSILLYRPCNTQIAGITRLNLTFSLIFQALLLPAHRFIVSNLVFFLLDLLGFIVSEANALCPKTVCLDDDLWQFLRLRHSRIPLPTTRPNGLFSSGRLGHMVGRYMSIFFFSELFY
jgi:hypothetical protein